jgi:hypothetical protein
MRRWATERTNERPPSVESECNAPLRCMSAGRSWAPSCDPRAIYFSRDSPTLFALFWLGCGRTPHQPRTLVRRAGSQSSPSRAEGEGFEPSSDRNGPKRFETCNGLGDRQLRLGQDRCCSTSCGPRCHTPRTLPGGSRKVATHRSPSAYGAVTTPPPWAETFSSVSSTCST